ncbi:MAG: hypothetical protein EOP09_17885 [Proteobacteria bacterium]|nr:MAG: hypothetical protein EOP09_17885 [Pseudomonadota bacterium]
MNASQYKSAVLTFTCPMEIRPFSGMVWLNQIRDPKNDYDLYLELIVKAVEENRKLRNLKLNDLQMLLGEKVALTL